MPATEIDALDPISTIRRPSATRSPLAVVMRVSSHITAGTSTPVSTQEGALHAHRLRHLLTCAAIVITAWLVSAAAADVVVPRDVPERARDLMQAPVERVEINDFISMARGIGNVFMIRTSEGNVIYDTGVTWQSEAQRELLRETSKARVTHVLVSHAHGDHNGGIAAWQKDLDAGAELVAHERYAYTNRIYGDTDHYLWRVRTGTLYPAHDRAMVQEFRSYEPTRTVDVHEDHAFELGGIRFQVIAAEGSAEGEDALLLWLPDHKILLTGDFYGCLYPMVPNLYTVRGEKVRDPLDYIAALDRLTELRPAMLLPAHFDPVRGEEYIKKTLEVTRDGVQYVYDETVEGMNAGTSVWELMRTIELPPELEITQGHGKTSWNVRAIWELLAGWFYYEDVADLYHVPGKAVYPDLVELAGGAATIVARAKQRFEGGDGLEALRLLDVAKAAGPETDTALALRLQILEGMLEISENGLDNMSETGILRASVKQTREQLAATRE
jgi:alkyl sulfatase BDS1-like metallo-beta-lactamase superfamily hydrolase